MKISCPYCGRIHERSYDCGRKPKRKAVVSKTREASFRRTEAWKQMSLRIRDRDHYLCQVCLRGLYQYGSKRPLTYDGLSVHHAVPVEQDWDRRLDPDNLLTLCQLHHEMAEAGEISREEIIKIIKEQQSGGAAGNGIGAPGG